MSLQSSFSTVLFAQARDFLGHPQDEPKAGCGVPGTNPGVRHWGYGFLPPARAQNTIMTARYPNHRRSGNRIGTLLPKHYFSEQIFEAMCGSRCSTGPNRPQWSVPVSKSQSLFSIAEFNPF